MSRKLLPGMFILLAALALALPGFAAPIKKTIHIRQSLKVGNKMLAAGEYGIIVDGNETTFTKNGKIVAKLTCEVQDSGTKSTQDAVYYENGAIIELHFSGQSEVVKFNPVAASTGAPKSNSTVR